MNAGRLYRNLDPGEGRVTLYHARENHALIEAFSAQEQVGDFSRTSPLNQMRIALTVARRVRARASDFDVFHGMTAFWYSMIPALAAESRGVPAVVKVAASGTEVAAAGSALRQGIQRVRFRSFRQVTAFVAISSSIAEALEHAGVPGERIHRIPNGVDVDLFSPRELGEREDGPLRVLFAGAVTRRKRPHLVVDALPDLRRQVDCELWIAGPVDDVAYAREIEGRARALGVEGAVRFLGFVDDMSDLYRRADVLCLPSSGEGMANVVLEAMASALPFVVTEASGMGELVGTGGGVMSAPDGPSLARALLEVLSSPAGFGAAGLDAAQRRYSTSVVLRRHLDLFGSIT